MRVWVVTAAVLAFLHAGACLLGAIGMGLTADSADPMTTDEALGVAAVVALTAVATGVCAIVALAGRPWPLLGTAVVSLAISTYVAVRVASNPGGYQLPLLFAVLPVAVVIALVVGFTRRPVPA